MKKYLSTLVCGFSAGVLMVAPIIKLFSCCLIIPAAAVVSLLLDQKANPSGKKITIQKGIVFGLFTGFFAAIFATFFEIFITLFVHSNDLTENYQQLLETWQAIPDKALLKTVTEVFSKIINDIETHGFSLLYSILLLFNNLIAGLIFGLIGGLLGMKIVNTNLEKQEGNF